MGDDPPRAASTPADTSDSCTAPVAGALTLLASWLGGDGAAGDGAAGEGDRLALNAQLTPLPQGAWLQLSYAF